MSRREVQQFGYWLIAREVAKRLDDILQLHLKPVDRVRGAEDATDLERACEGRYDRIPTPLSDRRDCQVALAIHARGKGIKRSTRCVGDFAL